MTLQAEIKSIQRELLALKTAHKRGLGVVDFFSRDIRVDVAEYTIASAWEISIEAVFSGSGEETFAYIEMPSWKWGEDSWGVQTNGARFVQNSIVWNILGWGQPSNPITFRIVSTEAISSVQVEEA